MAYTVSTTKKTVYGDERVHHLLVTADAATGAFDSGLAVLTSAQLSIKSAPTGGVKLKINELTASTSSAGSVAITGAVSGDDFYLTVFGR